MSKYTTEAEKLNYYYLKEGDIVQLGDEHDASFKTKGWLPVVHGIGRKAPSPLFSSHTRYRRRIKA